MLTMLRKRLQNEDEGFTLIELMVVVLIIAILIAIAIPTFLGAQDRARDRGAQSDLRNGITAAKTIATDDAGRFTSVNADSLTSAEGALDFVSGDASSTDEVGVHTDNDAYVMLHKQSASDTWFGIVATRTGQVRYCSGTDAENATVTVGADGNVSAGCNDAAW